MNSNKLLLLLTAITICISTMQAQTETLKIVPINMRENSPVKLSEITDEIKKISLELTNESLIGSIERVIYKDNQLIIIEGKTQKVMLFDLQGKYIRQIGSKGQGPGEYTEVISEFWDEKREQICLWSHPNYMFYNLDGTLSHKINRDEHPFYPSIVCDDYHVSYVNNKTGNETKRLIIQDSIGVIVDSIPNFRTWEKTRNTTGVRYLREAKFHVFRNELYYKDMYSDTLYHINNHTLQPRYIFDVGGLTVPYQMHSWSKEEMYGIPKGENRYEKYVVVEKLLEDANNLFFIFDYKNKRYPAIYEKKEDILQIMSPITISPQERGREWLYPLYGFKNDLDGGLLFWPEQMILEKEMMCVYTAEELLKLDISKVTNVKLKNVLNNIQEDNNPIVAIVTLKK